MFAVQQAADGDLFLKVLVGGIAMYEVEKKLTDEMVEAFKVNPISLLPWVKEIRLAG